MTWQDPPTAPAPADKKGEDPSRPSQASTAFRRGGRRKQECYGEGQNGVETRRTVIDAPLERVWAAADFTGSAGPYPMEVRNAGDPDRNGAGFTRAVTSGKKTIIERLLEVDPMRSYTYTLAEGAPVKDDYRGVVEFTPLGSSTQLTWSADFTAKYPGTGWLSAIVSRNIVKKIVDQIEAECRTPPAH